MTCPTKEGGADGSAFFLQDSLCSVLFCLIFSVFTAFRVWLLFFFAVLLTAVRTGGTVGTAAAASAALFSPSINPEKGEKRQKKNKGNQKIIEKFHRNISQFPQGKSYPAISEATPKKAKETSQASTHWKSTTSTVLPVEPSSLLMVATAATQGV